MELSQNARLVLEARYLEKDAQGHPAETPEEMLGRVARTVAAAEAGYGDARQVSRWEEEFFGIMDSLSFLPNSPTLMNAGRELGQLAACFVLPVEDSMEGIFNAVRDAALIHKSGGGTGFSFSRIRPQGARVQTTGGVASGPISFMKVFNAATEAVRQGGTRRGANMGILNVDHPDILAFITAKEDSREINNFNLSVGITDAFMDALAREETYPLVDPSTGEETGRLPAREVFRQICQGAWKNGEPGLVFLDRINEANPLPALGRIESTNPCGEQPLLPYEACNLGSINLLQVLAGPPGDPAPDWEKLDRLVATAVRFLDDVIDVNRYPLPEIERVSRQTRKIGLGVMGFADLLLRMKIPYDSPRGVELGGEIMQRIDRAAWAASRDLASERGVFPAFGQSVYAGRDQPVRNSTRTTIAPTGTLSLLAGVSSGIEPLFALAFLRNVLDGTRILEIDPVFAETLEERGLDPGETGRALAAGELSREEVLPPELQAVFVTAAEVSPAGHVRMQAAFQAHTDNAVSKTVNFPRQASLEDVEETFRLAYGQKLKGITIYRDGSRTGQVLSVGPPPAGRSAPRERPVLTRGLTEKVRIGCGNLYVTVNDDADGLCEVFTNLGRGGGCPSQSEATSRLVSIALRAGVSPESVIEQLQGIRCQSTLRRKMAEPGIGVLSCPDAIGRALERALSNGVPAGGPAPSGVSCPECGSPVEHEGGCLVCRSCGFSRCG